ncbi:MAG: tyrosine-type recombinase/integrase [Bryobacteraceae bacterium]
MRHTPQAARTTGGSGLFDLVKYLLEDESEKAMTRYQDPKVEVRRDVKRPFYFIRPYVPLVTEHGIQRRQRKTQLGFCDEMTMRQARAAKQQVMALINAGKFLLQSQIRFDAVVQKFLDARVPQLAAPTQAKYRGCIKNYIRPAFRNMRMCDIDPPTVTAWLNHAAEPVTLIQSDDMIKKSGLGWWARQDLRNVLSAIFTKATEWRLWEGRNPCEGVDVSRRREKREKKIPQKEQLDRFLAALSDTAICTVAQARLMVLVAVVAGLRVSEVLGLKPSDIDGVKETLEIRRRWHRGDIDVPKSEASKRVRQIGPLAGDLLRLAHGIKSDEFLFARSDGNPPDDRDLQQHVFRPAAKAVGIYFQGFGMHTFRRLNISWRQEVGATPFEAMRAAGHASPSTTWLYTITDQERERQQVCRILDRIGGDVRSAVN